MGLNELIFHPKILKQALIQLKIHTRRSVISFLSLLSNLGRSLGLNEFF